MAKGWKVTYRSIYIPTYVRTYVRICLPPSPLTFATLQRKTLRRQRALQEASAQDPQAEVTELPPVPLESEQEVAKIVAPPVCGILTLLMRLGVPVLFVPACHRSPSSCVTPPPPHSSKTLPSWCLQRSRSETTYLDPIPTDQETSGCVNLQ